MKYLISTLAFGAVLISSSAMAQNNTSMPVSSYSPPQVIYGQPQSSLTRAQVLQELADLRSVGYNPSTDLYNYPDELQAAEKRLWNKRHGINN